MSNLTANKEIALGIVDALARIDAERFLGYLSDDVMFETPGSHPGGGIKTKVQVAKELGALKDAMPDGLRFSILSVTAEEDRVVVDAAGEATTSSGAPYNNAYVFTVVIAGDRVVSFRDYKDTALAKASLNETLDRHGAVRAQREAENGAPQR